MLTASISFGSNEERSLYDYLSRANENGLLVVKKNVLKMPMRLRNDMFFDHLWDPNKNIVEGKTIPPSSYHFGGVNLLLLDGSVRFIEEQVDHATWSELGSISGDAK